jgi:toxin ParE1/3/4
VRRAVVFSPESLRDFDQLFDYIAEQSGAKRALAYTRRVKAHCLSLGDFAERGTRRDDLQSGLRVTGFERRVAIAFHVGTKRVIIDRVLYGGRDLRRAFPEEE